MWDTCLHESVSDAADRIKRLEVQGARNVAITAIKAIEAGAKRSKSKEKQGFLEELMELKRFFSLLEKQSL